MLKHFIRRMLFREKKSEDLINQPSIQQILQMMQEKEKAETEAQPCSFSFYCETLKDLPLPTMKQRQNFVEFVAHAHSWYKHLPRYHGTPFQFYIDRYAGCDRKFGLDGSMKQVERRKNGFHYSDIPTGQYRKQFGYLAYACNSGTMVVAGGGEGNIAIPHDNVATIATAGNRLYRLPPEIAEAGTVELTSVIHVLSSHFPLWDMHNNKAVWPEESGGQEVLEKIFARCKTIRSAGTMKMMTDSLRTRHGWVDPVLDELLRPERERQHGEMLKAMNRVCEIVENTVKSA